jgi:micrococcal nuclease
MLNVKDRVDRGEARPGWEFGIDRRHVAAYVGIALIAGFAFGFVAAKYLGAGQIAIKEAQLREQAQAMERKAAAPDAAAALAPGEFRKVTNIIHADTIEVEGVGPVRILGVETPDGRAPQELYAALGQSAVDFTKKALLNQDVRLEFDPATSAAGNKDESGNMLAYVYTRDGALFNAELIKQGMAFARVTQEFKMEDEFRGFEREAMEAMRGVWGSGGSSALASTANGAAHGLAHPEGDPKSKKLTPLLPSDLDARSGITPALAPNEPMVWVSPADHMYHKEGCSYLDKKKHAISLSEAKAGGYVACGRCFASTVLKAQ